jgi:UDP-N-acetylmuramoyl-L-alanyl-D-glutamate--2,6-diaminopimelate ligase
MKFLELLATAAAQSAVLGGNPAVTGLEHDSRRVRPGNVFVAMQGEKTDGNRFIDAAVAAGAVAVVTDSAQAAPREGVAWARVPHGRRALAEMSARFFKYPERKLKLSGITGTNGKTTTSFLLESILQAAGRKVVLIGTIEYHVADQVFSAPHTTPESLEIHRLFSSAVEHGATEAVMEVSSHALAQDRIYGLPFDVAVFTNLTRDHLDYHADLDQYFAAKKILFTGSGSPPPPNSAVNTDDTYGAQLEEICQQNGSRVVGYGLFSGDFRAQQLHLTPQGTKFEMVAPRDSITMESQLIGRVNVYNILAASAAAYARGCSLRQIADGVRALRCVPGRFERVDCGQPFSVVVDYAHTEDALRNLLTVARDFVGRTHDAGRVITVFGCGGDRDRNKRPLMGHAAGSGSDVVVVTSDNPRSEDPMAIIQEVLEGVERSGVTHTVEPDRRRAITFAVAEARKGDTVLIAGKGHEKVQVTRDGSSSFDDVAVAREALHERGFTAPRPEDARSQA